MTHDIYPRRHPIAVYAVVMCLSVCLSTGLSQVGVLLKWLKCRIKQTKPHDGTGRLIRRPFVEVAQLSQRDRATHELRRFAKLRSGIFEPPFWRLRGNVDASCVRLWKKRARLPIGLGLGDELDTLASTHSCGIAKWRFLSNPLGDLGGLRGKVGALPIPRWKARDRLPISDK